MGDPDLKEPHQALDKDVPLGPGLQRKPTKNKGNN